MACPACGSIKNVQRQDLGVQVYECRKCNGIHGTCYLGESYGIVLPRFTADPTADERAIYFDFITLGSAGVGRRHGWFDPTTKLITQVG